MKNEQVARAFYEGDTAKNSNESFYIENINGVNVVFSYGSHFPISIKFIDGFLFNKNGYSSTTARQKNLILSYIKHELSDEDFKTTEELKDIVSKIRYGELKTKAELIEQKI